MTTFELWALVLGMAFVTFVPRYLPFFLAGKLALPSWVEKSLEYVPIAILTIIISQTVAYRDAELMLTVSNPYLLSAAVAILAALVQSRLYVTIACGMISYVLIKFLM